MNRSAQRAGAGRSKAVSLATKVITRFNLVYWSARLRAPFLTYLLVRPLSRFLDRQSQYNVLCLGRPIFEEDIEGLAKYGGKLNYLIIPKSVFLSIFSYFIPQLLLSHAKYYEEKGYDRQKSQYRSFLSKLLKIVGNDLRIDAILTANYNYSWQQELAIAARDLNIPFVVLFKEGISPLFTYRVSPEESYSLLVSNYTNNNFIGSKLLVYNERIKEGFDHSGISGIEDGIVEAVGIPRFDRYFRLRSQGDDLVFFSFNFEDKARHLGLSRDEYERYLAKTREFHVEVMKFAAEHPRQKVIIKTKNHIKYLKYVEEIASTENLEDLPNLILTNQGDVYELIRNAQAVIGYNSTALLEAFAARRIVMTPDFRWGIVRDYFDEYPELAKYVANASDIADVLSKGRPVSLDDPDLSSLLRERIHIPDGKACERTETAIQDAIIASKGQRMRP